MEDKSRVGVCLDSCMSSPKTLCVSVDIFIHSNRPYVCGSAFFHLNLTLHSILYRVMTSVQRKAGSKSLILEMLKD